MGLHQGAVSVQKNASGEKIISNRWNTPEEFSASQKNIVAKETEKEVLLNDFIQNVKNAAH